jgi:hypothetical protein
VDAGADLTLRRPDQAPPTVDAVVAMKVWLKAELNRVPPRGGLADAIRYAFTRWNALCRFLDDGRIELDTNTVERAVRRHRAGRSHASISGA